MKTKLTVAVFSVVALIVIVYGVLQFRYKPTIEADSNSAGVSGTVNNVTETFKEVVTGVLETVTAPEESDPFTYEDNTESTAESVLTTDNGYFTGRTSENKTKENKTTEKKTTAEKVVDRKKNETTAPAATTGAVSTTAAATSKQAAQGSYEYSYAGFNPTYIQITDSNWEMVLVNRHYIIQKDYVPELAYAITSDTSSKKLDKRVAPHYNEMYLAAAKEGIYLTTVSGYRSYELQRTNFENKINKYVNQGMDRVKATQEAAKIILPPGTSEHNAGLAMDIISLEQSFENTKAFRWLCENAADYGFILRYPKDKQDITEIIYEPWHWRYVGVKNAKAIKASGLCLEEYLNKVPA